MSPFAFALVVAMNFFGPAAHADPLLVGRWNYAITRYRGGEIPRPNPNLRLSFEFGADGISQMTWSYAGEAGFCRQRSRYRAKDGELFQRVIWVSPENRRDCDADPQMRPGNRSTTPYRIRDGRLETDFPLGEETLTYIWIKEDF